MAKQTMEEVFTKKELKTIKSKRPLYKTKEGWYTKTGYIKELWKHNEKYGYDNFICYLDNLSDITIGKAILKHIQELAEESKQNIEIF